MKYGKALFCYKAILNSLLKFYRSQTFINQAYRQQYFMRFCAGYYLTRNYVPPYFIEAGYWK